MFTTYWNFQTDTGMVPQVDEPTLPSTVKVLAKAAPAMAHREGAPQGAHHNANKAQQKGCQIHPRIRDKDGNFQLHSPWMVHFILEDHGDNWKGTDVQIIHALAQTHLHHTVPTSNIIITYGEAQMSTYRLLADTEDTAYTVYTWARYADLPAPIWHPDQSWHQPLHGRRVLRQSAKLVGSNATGAHGIPPRTSLTPPSQTPGCPSSIQGAAPGMTPPTAGRGAPSERPCTTTSTETKRPGSTRALSPSGRVDG